jgi:hypothetical protein
MDSGRFKSQDHVGPYCKGMLESFFGDVISGTGTGKMKRLPALLLCSSSTLFLCGCLPNAGGSQQYSVTELKCEQQPLDQDNKCAAIKRLGADLEILVNQVTQKVQITVERNDGNWGVKSFVLDGCSVVDTRNWKCTDGTLIVDTYGMTKGHFYRTLIGGDSPNHYTSSVSGWRQLAVRYGLMKPEFAQSFD